jgi:hypothetical protein
VFGAVCEMLLLFPMSSSQQLLLLHTGADIGHFHTNTEQETMASTTTASMSAQGTPGPIYVDTQHEDLVHDAQMDYYGCKLATASSGECVAPCNKILGTPVEFGILSLRYLPNSYRCAPCLTRRRPNNQGLQYLGKFV